MCQLIYPCALNFSYVFECLGRTESWSEYPKIVPQISSNIDVWRFMIFPPELIVHVCVVGLCLQIVFASKSCK